jgi:hypothetical protein
VNELVKSYLGRIEQSIDTLQDTLKNAHEQLAAQQEGQERLLKQYWSRVKELSTLGEAVKDLETLQNENERLKATHQELQDRARRVLEYAKQLTDELRR